MFIGRFWGAYKSSLSSWKTQTEQNCTGLYCILNQGAAARISSQRKSVPWSPDYTACQGEGNEIWDQLVLSVSPLLYSLTLSAFLTCRALWRAWRRLESPLPQFTSESFLQGCSPRWSDRSLLCLTLCPMFIAKGQLCLEPFSRRGTDRNGLFLRNQERMPEINSFAYAERKSKPRETGREETGWHFFEINPLGHHSNEMLRQHPLFPSFTGSAALIRKSQVPEWGAELGKFKQNDIFQEELD